MKHLFAKDEAIASCDNETSFRKRQSYRVLLQ